VLAFLEVRFSIPEATTIRRGTDASQRMKHVYYCTELQKETEGHIRPEAALTCTELPEWILAMRTYLKPRSDAADDEQDRFSGYSWEGREQVVPRVISAIEGRRRSPRAVTHSSTAHWLLSYTYTSFGLSCIGRQKGAWLPRAAGSVHLYPPRTDFWEDTRQERGHLHSVWMHFVGAQETGLDQLIQPEGTVSRFYDPTCVVGDLISEAARAGRELGEEGFWRAQSAFCRLVDVLLASSMAEKSAHDVGEPGSHSHASDFVRRVDALLRDHTTERLDLDHIAGALHMSVSSLSHRYRREAGVPPLVRHRRIRVEYAKALLLRRHSLKEIADAMGFSDAYHLSKVFKQTVGVPPREFVRKAFAGS
jgi:AraC family transcriptional regulator of arabinose operon